MDISEVALNQIAALGSKTVNDTGPLTDFEDQKRMKVAKNFEAIVIGQILETMKQTIPESDIEDSTSNQVHSMYWSFLGDALSEQGGFGLWEQIYESMPKDQPVEQVEPNLERLDESV